MALNRWQWWNEFRKLWEAPSPEPGFQVGRILRFQRGLVMPAKLVVAFILIQSLFVADWIPPIAVIKADLLPLLKQATVAFTTFSIAAFLTTLLMQHLIVSHIRWVAFGLGLVDGVYLALLTLATGGFESALFWAFLALIVVNALSIPISSAQLVLNLGLSAMYMAVGIGCADIVMTNVLVEQQQQVLALRSIDTFLIRLIAFWLLTACCYGLQVLAARQRQVEEEAREFAARQGQIQTAGRLAAEIAHQVKNPLAIINNATFSLRRALANGKTDVSHQLQIIQEEIERSDRIITQLMGYARLAEGKVEKLDIKAELERALDEVLPVAAGFEIEVQRDYAARLPVLFMQRGHLNTIFVNLFQNAREALEGRGHLRVATRATSTGEIEITIQDHGPGIPAEHSERIFEAYFTTKGKGTGLGLAIVKHNVELYDGKIRVESGLGKGAKFVILFPAKALTDAANKF